MAAQNHPFVKLFLKNVTKKYQHTEKSSMCWYRCLNLMTLGYCPCRFQRIEENVCMCQEFRDQIADPEFEGFCHCRLYYKEK